MNAGLAPSVGGSYKGVFPAGLLTTLAPAPHEFPLLRLYRRDPRLPWKVCQAQRSDFFCYIISGNVLSGLLLLFLLLLDIIVVIVFRTSVFSTPALPQITVKVLEGHQPLGTQQEAVSELELERHLMGPGVRRVPLREGRVRATLFLPPGPGPFPGVIDMFGTAGGLMEFRAGEILLLLHIFFLF